MSHIPYRTGLTTLRMLLEKACNLITRYEAVMKAVLPTSQHIYLDAVVAACNNFILNTDNPRP